METESELTTQWKGTSKYSIIGNNVWLDKEWLQEEKINGWWERWRKDLQTTQGNEWRVLQRENSKITENGTYNSRNNTPPIKEIRMAQRKLRCSSER